MWEVGGRGGGGGGKGEGGGRRLAEQNLRPSLPTLSTIMWYLLPALAELVGKSRSLRSQERGIYK